MLLDTNALLWVYHDSAKLGPKSRERIVKAARVCFSSVSVLEIVVKHMLGRLEKPGGERFPEVFLHSGLQEVTFTSAHAAAMGGFPTLSRHDPFDRMLLAQAAQEQLPFLASDATLLTLGEEWIHDARL